MASRDLGDLLASPFGVFLKRFLDLMTLLAMEFAAQIMYRFWGGQWALCCMVGPGQI